MAVDIYLPGFNAWKDADLVKNREKLPYMKSMVLNGAGITDEGLSLIPECTKLRELHLVCTNVSNQGLKYVAQVNTLDWLQIDQASINDKGLHELSSLSNLNSLQIVNTDISDDGLEALFHYPKLQYLEAASDRIGGKGLSIISQQQSIETLRLASRTVYDKEFLNLVFCKNVKSLSYDMPMVSREAYEELNSRLPNCFINHFVYYNSKEKFNLLMLHVMELYLDGKYDYALNAINDALKYNHKHPIVYGFKALILLKLGSYFGFNENMEKLYELAVAYDDFDMKVMSTRYLKIPNMNTLQLAIAKDRPEELLMTTLNKEFKSKPKGKVPHLILVPNKLGPLLIPPPIQTPAQFLNVPSFQSRANHLDNLGFMVQDDQSGETSLIIDQSKQGKNERPEQILLEKIREQIKKDNKPNKGKGSLPPWEW